MKGNILLKVIICLVIISALYLVVPTRGDGNGLCTGEDATLRCLMQYSKELYESNNSLFWDILNKAAEKAEECDSISDTTGFMELVRIKRDGALEEFFHKRIEMLCISKTDCFLKAAKHLPMEDQVKIIDVLTNPLFVDQSEITEAVNKKRNDKQFRDFIDIYFKKIMEKNRGKDN